MVDRGAETPPPIPRPPGPGEGGSTPEVWRPRSPGPRLLRPACIYVQVHVPLCPCVRACVGACVWIHIYSETLLQEGGIFIGRLSWAQQTRGNRGITNRCWGSLENSSLPTGFLP